MKSWRGRGQTPHPRDGLGQMVTLVFFPASPTLEDKMTEAEYRKLAEAILDDAEAKRRWISIFNAADVRSMQVSALAHFLSRTDQLRANPPYKPSQE